MKPGGARAAGRASGPAALRAGLLASALLGPLAAAGQGEPAVAPPSTAASAAVVSPSTAASAAVVSPSTAASAAVVAPSPAASSADEQAAAGRRLYVMSCQRCHGIDLATNGIGFDLRTFPRDGKARFLHSVTHGKNAMPAWGATLKAEQIELIWAYVGRVNGW